MLAAVGLAFGRRQPALPDPNGYNRLVALAVEVPNEVTALPRTNSPAVTEFALRYTNLVADVAVALALPSVIPLQYSLDDVARSVRTGASLPRLDLANYARRERRWLLVGSKWWRDWDTLRELPTDLFRTTTKVSFAGSPALRFTNLERAYAGTEAAIVRRSLELANSVAPLPPPPKSPCPWQSAN